MRGEHLLPSCVARGVHAGRRLLAGSRRTGERRLDLLETGKACLLKHQANVRVRDQRALTIDHEALPSRPIRIRDTTSQMNLRFTSTTVTPAFLPLPATAIVM